MMYERANSEARMADVPDPTTTAAPSPPPVATLVLGVIGAAFCVPHYQLLAAFFTVLVSHELRPSVIPDQLIFVATLVVIFLFRLATVADMAVPPKQLAHGKRREFFAGLLSFYLRKHAAYAVLTLGCLVLLLPAKTTIFRFAPYIYTVASLASLAYSIRLLVRVTGMERTGLPKAPPPSRRASIAHAVMGCCTVAVLLAAGPAIEKMLYGTLLAFFLFALPFMDWLL